MDPQNLFLLRELRREVCDFQPLCCSACCNVGFVSCDMALGFLHRNFQGFSRLMSSTFCREIEDFDHDVTYEYHVASEPLSAYLY